jgi:filamentous hemagglutinin family protein
MRIVKEQIRKEGCAHTPLVMALILLFVSQTIPSVAAPPIPGLYGSQGRHVPSVSPTALPIPLPGGLLEGASIERPHTNQLTVRQHQPKAIIDWQSFNIGEDGRTHFDQKKNVDWRALNRIYDKDPSQILGKFTADGRIYLINQNGILFGPNATVDVHALVASALNITDEDFLDSILSFDFQNYQNQPNWDADTLAAVSNHGAITTDKTGSVLLVAPMVENSGVILAPVGEIRLVAGKQFVLSYDSFGSPVYKLDPGKHGEATNLRDGELIADTGLAGMYGRMVNQEGLIKSVAAIRRGGKIELRASEKISTGKESLTATPVSTSSETIVQSSPFGGGMIHLSGLDKNSPTKQVEHGGAIAAPSGDVSVTAEERVYLDEGSVIDVGGMWVDKSGETNLVEAQLNSVQLRDDYGQKQGLLQGEWITAHPLYGSTIGDISGHLSAEERTALEQATNSGTVRIGCKEGDIIVREDALIDFSGGGIRYEEARIDTTKLLAAETIYDISDAPQWVTYDALLGHHKKVYEKFGVVVEHEGLYCGGAFPLRDYVSGYTEAGDAGRVDLIGRTVVLNGILDGSVEAGFFQTKEEESENKSGEDATRGLTRPKGGTLALGDETERPFGELSDYVLEEVTIRDVSTPLPEGFAIDSPLPSRLASDLSDSEGNVLYQTVLSSSQLNASGVEDVRIFANTKATIEADTDMTLPTGGRFEVVARGIESAGAIEVPAGQVHLITEDNTTTSKVEMTERIHMAPGSSLSVAGERIDNTLLAYSGQALGRGLVSGGDVSITEGTSLGDGITMGAGASIVVSGGYEIDQAGRLTGGDAGALTLKGPTLVLDGVLQGHSLMENLGGAISLHAGEVFVTPSSSFGPSLPEGFTFDSEMPDALEGQLTLADNRLEETGFTRIELISGEALNVEKGAVLSPSRVKMADPVLAHDRVTSTVSNYHALGETTGQGWISVAPEYLLPSSVKLVAAEALLPDVPPRFDRLHVASGAEIRVNPGGEIALEGPAVEVGGRLEAPAGRIAIVATAPEFLSGVENALTMGPGSRILAEGFNRQKTEPFMKGLPAGFVPLGGGHVNLEAEEGTLFFAAGSLVDVSGSEPVERFFENADRTMSSVTVAGNPGTVELRYQEDMVLDGEFTAHAKMDGLRGGGLTIGRTNQTEALAISADDVKAYGTRGFDALTFQSLVGVRFSGSMKVDTGRSLTLDAPEILGEEGQQIRLNTAWMRLVNSSGKYSLDDPSYTYIPAQAEAGKESSFSVSADWLDIEGSVTISGFEGIGLCARHDMTLTDEIYETQSGLGQWEGMVKVPQDLALEAARIYPTTQSSFTIQASGTVTTAASGVLAEDEIYSAGGSLTIEANKILHRGVLAAPMGVIELSGAGNNSRIYLEGGSLMTTKGEGGPVQFGQLSEEMFWTRENRENPRGARIPVERAPETSIHIAGDHEVIVREGAEIDASGGGQVFSYLFLPGIQGSKDPLKRDGRYVIVPGMDLPGDAVYLEGTEGLPAGTYSLCPEAYAFLPGAFVITDLGELETELRPGEQVFSEEGYRMVTGYGTVTGTEIRSPAPRGYALRPASEVLEEGLFNIRRFIAGDAGSMLFDAATTILDGTIRGEALHGYEGGLLSLSGAETAIVRSATSLPSDFGFGQDLPGAVQDKLVVRSAYLTGAGVRTLDVGSLDTTYSVTLEEGAVLRAPHIRLSAMDEIVLESGSRVEAIGGGGTATFISPQGALAIEQDALAHASEAVNLETSNLILDGAMKVDSSRLNIQGESIFVVPDGHSGDTSNGIYLTENLKEMEGFSRIGVLSRNDVTFLGGVDLTVSEELTIDAKRIAGLASEEGNRIAVRSQEINLLNAGEGFAGNGFDDQCTIDFSAQELAVGPGDVLFDGFTAIRFNGEDDLTFRGEGSLVSSGELHFSAARLTTSYYQGPDTPYEVADYVVDAGAEHAITIGSVNGINGDTRIPGGTLEFLGRSIQLSGTIDVPSGRVKLTAAGSGEGDGIFLAADARILARGCDTAPGGLVALRTREGKVSLESGSLIDISAGGQGDAGSISVVAPEKEMLLAGTLRADALDGKGGSFVLDTHAMASFASLNKELQNSGFDEVIDIRVRTGDITLSADDAVVAHAFRLVADEGDISHYGSIKALGEQGGKAELHAGKALSLFEGSLVDTSSRAIDVSGGEVILSAAEGWLNVYEGARIEASCGPASAPDDPVAIGGTVHLRAPRSEDGEDVLMNLEGTLTGASRVVAEGVKTYETTSIDTAHIQDWRTETQAFLSDHGDRIEDTLLGGLTLEDAQTGSFYFVPGVEVQSAEDLTLTTNWDLTNWHSGEQGATGVLTLRAEGNLSIHGHLLDHPTENPFGVQKSPELDSWGFNLIAGADLESADVLAVNGQTGDLKIGDEKLVYTESGPLRFASGGDTDIGRGHIRQHMPVLTAYNLATFDGTILGKVGGDLHVRKASSAIQSATGDIAITVGGSLDLGSDGAIRTTGYRRMTDREMADFQLLTFLTRNYTEYVQGGDISLHVGNEITGTALSVSRWDGKFSILDYGDIHEPSDDRSENRWAANYKEGVAGIATMGGGQSRVYCGGDFESRMGTFGQNAEGDLTLYAGGDIDGRFLIRQGQGTIGALGSFGTHVAGSAIELFDAQVDVSAQGEVTVGAILNPTIARPGLQGDGGEWGFLGDSLVQYTEESAARLSAAFGDVRFAGDSRYYPTADFQRRYQCVLPPTLEVSAPAGDILFLYNQFALTPAPEGHVSLQAGGDISGYWESSGGGIFPAKIVVSDLAPTGVYDHYPKPQYAARGSSGEISRIWEYQFNVVHLFSGQRHGLPSEFVDMYNEMMETEVDLPEGYERLLNDSAQAYFQNLDLRSLSRPLHKEDKIPLEIAAGGDIKSLNLYLPKQANIAAARDILDIYVSGQNISPEDGTALQAGRDLVFSSLAGATQGVRQNTGIECGGPGLLLVQAGNTIDLGTTNGLQTIANLYNPQLGSKGSSLIAISGYEKDWELDEITTFFDNLRGAGKEYAGRLSEDPSLAMGRIQEARNAIIDPFFSDSLVGNGDIDMTKSQIKTVKDSDIYVIAAGRLSVGRSALTGEENGGSSGIYTESGGGINIFSVADMDVLESRVMTFSGGDITAWSDKGDINAGRGSKTAISQPEIETILDPETGEIVERRFSPPAVGSGIRTLTYDPDGFEGPLEAPPAGDAYLFAPQGIIDAGEAGIAAKNVVLGATEVVNVQNISFSAGSVGVPVSSETTAGLGALAGAGSVTEAAKMAEESAGVASARERATRELTELAEAFSPTWMKVEFIGFEEEEDKKRH